MTITINLSAADADRIYFIKERDKTADNLTVNQFAAQILCAELHRMCPARPTEDDF